MCGREYVYVSNDFEIVRSAGVAVFMGSSVDGWISWTVLDEDRMTMML